MLCLKIIAVLWVVNVAYAEISENNPSYRGSYVEDVTATSLSLYWPSSAPTQTVNYKIQIKPSPKRYRDANGLESMAAYAPREVVVQNACETTITDLNPFTHYIITISADSGHLQTRPASVSIQTQLDAPVAMARPEILEKVGEDKFQVSLPQPSDENGPISFYYLAVVPRGASDEKIWDDPIYFTHTDLVAGVNDGDDVNRTPYIAVKFPERNIPWTYTLGTGEANSYIVNRKLVPGVSYRVFVRAFVEGQGEILDRSSPFSEYFSLPAPEGQPISEYVSRNLLSRTNSPSYDHNHGTQNMKLVFVNPNSAFFNLPGAVANVPQIQIEESQKAPPPAGIIKEPIVGIVNCQKVPSSAFKAGSKRQSNFVNFQLSCKRSERTALQEQQIDENEVVSVCSQIAAEDSSIRTKISVLKQELEKRRDIPLNLYESFLAIESYFETESRGSTRSQSWGV